MMERRTTTKRLQEGHHLTEDSAR